MREIRVHSVQPLRQAHLSPFYGEADRVRARELMEENVTLACRLLSQAGRAGTDIVCYPEDIQGIAHYGYYLDDIDLFTGLVETVPGPTTERVAEVARRHDMHVVFGIFEREGGTIYNTAALIGRKGELLGKYRKTHLPAVEAWNETHGDGFPVFETDFGMVGMLICYDILFPEAARCLTLNGAEILFNPTMSYAAPKECEDGPLMRVRMRALDNFTPLVVSLCGRGSVLVDSFGNILAQARTGVEEVVGATIDLDDTPMDHSQWELFTGTADVKARLLQERRPSAYGALTAEHPPVLDRYADRRLRSTPREIREAYEEIRRRWSGRKA
jgi:N-carbamoylputrescine amidase